LPMKSFNKRHILWRDREKHKQFVISWLTWAMGWFQLVCFAYVAVNAIMMAMEHNEKAIEWSLIALIIKPYGPKVKE
jgi:hypothetical protein